MSNDNTLVLGATGKTGRRVAARLRMRGTPVRTASRSSETRFGWSDLFAPPTDGVATVLGREPRTFQDYVLRTAAAGAWRR
jgi:uncharacterized protein YbjT (DUF2867 family)